MSSPVKNLTNQGLGGLFLERDQKCNQTKSKPSFRYGAPLHALCACGHSALNFFWLYVCPTERFPALIMQVKVLFLYMYNKILY